MGLAWFLVQVVVVSLSGVMAPGAVTAATLAAGAKNRWAGAWIAAGHGIVEIPLIFLLLAGWGVFLKSDAARAAVGLAGGLFLVYLGIGMMRETGNAGAQDKAVRVSRPMLTGVVLSATNPYFLLWWATVGLNLAYRAKGYGWVAVPIFAAVHWMCDLAWLTILSLGAHAGSQVMKGRGQRAVAVFCGTVLVIFGAVFIYDGLGALRPAMS